MVKRSLLVDATSQGAQVVTTPSVWVSFVCVGVGAGFKPLLVDSSYWLQKTLVYSRYCCYQGVYQVLLGIIVFLVPCIGF
jgi:hypothetical protein